MAQDQALKAPKSPLAEMPKSSEPIEDHVALIWTDPKGVSIETVQAFRRAIHQVVGEMGLVGELTITDLSLEERSRVQMEMDIFYKAFKQTH